MPDPTPTSAVATATKTVTVKFLLVNGQPEFTYSGDGGSSGDLSLGPGTIDITVQLDSASTAGYALDSVSFSAIAPPHATVPLTYSRSGNNLVIRDVNDLAVNATAQQFCYQVVVKKGQSSYTAPDPKITNEPPSRPPL